MTVLSSPAGEWQTKPMRRDTPNCRGYRFPPEIISHAVWLYHRFLNFDPRAERCRAEMVHRDMRPDRALAFVEMLAHELQGDAFHVAHHRRRRVDAILFPEKCDRARLVDGDLWRCRNTWNKSCFHEAITSRCLDTTWDGATPPNRAAPSLESCHAKLRGRQPSPYRCG